jgi:hypothetical protein
MKSKRATNLSKLKYSDTEVCRMKLLVEFALVDVVFFWRGTMKTVGSPN